MDITFYAGDSRNFIVNVTDESNNPINLTNATIGWILTSQNTTILSKSIGKGITITNATGGQFTIAISASETKTLSGNYQHYVRVTTSSGDSSIVLSGTIIITSALI